MNKYILPIIFIITILLSGCAPSEEQLQKDAEQAAQGFAIAWQRGDYLTVYDYFIPQLQAKRSASDFALFARASDTISKTNIVYDKVVLQDDTTAFAYFNIGLSKANMELDYIDGEWKINGLATYFEKQCIVDDCKEQGKEYLDSRFYSDISECLDKHPSFGYEYCKKWVENTHYTVLNGFTYRCDKSTKYVCEMTKK